MTIHQKIRIKGNVQGVGFRGSAVNQAKLLDLTGFVRNEEDGSVYIEVEGERGEVEKFIAWCHKGSSFSRVDSVKILDGNIMNFDAFQMQ